MVIELFNEFRPDTEWIRLKKWKGFQGKVNGRKRQNPFTFQKWTAKKIEMAVQNDKVNGEKNRAAARAKIVSKVNGKIRGNDILNRLRLSDGLSKKSVAKPLESATIILKSA